MGRNFENRKNAIFKTAGQKSKLYSKYGKQLYVVAKSGVADPDVNPALRSLIEKPAASAARIFQPSATRDSVPAAQWSSSIA
jgi:transcriptional/translational regulatory protein YebC/TACO1